MKADRIHYLDSARMLLMVLGIPYHAALLFQKKITWYAEVGAASDTALYIASFIHVFRMPAFFIIAGYLAAIALEKRKPFTWLKRRLVVLLPPLLFGALFLHPVQQLVSWEQRGLLGNLQSSNLLKSFQDITAGTGIGHLWFILALVAICTITALVWRILPQPHSLSTHPNYIRVAIVLSTAVYVGIVLVLKNKIPTMHFPLHTTIGQGIENSLIGLPSFALGVAMVRYKCLAELLLPRDYTTIILPVLSAIIFAMFFPLEEYNIAARMASAALAIPVTMSLIALCRLRFNAQHPFAAWLSRSSFSIYLVHHPIIIGLGVLTAGVSLPWSVHYALIMVLTLAISAGIYMLVRGVPLLGPALGATAKHRE